LQLLLLGLPLAQGSGPPIVTVAQVGGETGRKGTMKDEITLCRWLEAHFQRRARACSNRITATAQRPPTAIGTQIFKDARIGWASYYEARCGVLLASPALAVR
jgi:hypothetical protein